MEEHILQYCNTIVSYRIKYGFTKRKQHRDSRTYYLNIRDIKRRNSTETLRFNHMLEMTDNFKLEFQLNRFRCESIREEIMLWFNLGIYLEGIKYGKRKFSDFNTVEDKICHFNKVLHLHKRDVKFHKLKIYNGRTLKYLERDIPNRHIVEFLLFLQIEVLKLEH
tara:strand:+ start:1920 stop:2414 length:495 start_codon:yes stop_codon:yes gene_type:complete